MKFGFVVHGYRQFELEQEKQVLQEKNKALEGQKQVLEHDNPQQNGGDNKFAVIRGQKTHTDAYTKKYIILWRGSKTVDFKHHPNPYQWAKLRKLLADHHKIEQLDGNIYQCINDYNLSTLMKDLKIKHKQQCVMVVSGPTMDDYLRDKPVLQQPAVADHNYCKVN